MYFWQSNCQICEAEKSELDDNENHATRNKGAAATFVGKACFEGVYPGWEDEYENRDTPLPIFSMAGQPPRLNCVPSRVKRAEKALGIRLQSNSTWNFPFFDCYVQVSATVFFCIFEAYMD